jgi:terminase small subunit-like protein
MKRRAPVPYTPELAYQIYLRMCDGFSLRKILADPGMPSRTAIFDWLGNPDPKYDRLRELYNRGVLYRQYRLAEEIMDIADDATCDWVMRTDKKGRMRVVVDHDRINRDRLRVDARKWELSHLLPKRFGHRIEIDIGEKAASAAASTTQATPPARDPLEMSISNWRKASRDRLEPIVPAAAPATEPVGLPRAKKAK